MSSQNNPKAFNASNGLQGSSTCCKVSFLENIWVYAPVSTVQGCSHSAIPLLILELTVWLRCQWMEVSAEISAQRIRTWASI